MTDGFFLTHSGGVEAVERVGKHAAACASQGEAKVCIEPRRAPICEHFGKALNRYCPTSFAHRDRLEMVELARQKGFEVDEEDPDIAALHRLASLPKNRARAGAWSPLRLSRRHDRRENGIEKRFAVAP